jgi:hypothetical protein
MEGVYFVIKIRFCSLSQFCFEIRIQMEKESKRESKRGSERKSKEYSCYSAKSVRIKTTQNSSINESSCKTHVYNGSTGVASSSSNSHN